MPKHSLAISYSMKKKKKASGGTVESGDSEMNYSKGGSVDPKGVHRNQPGKGRSLAGEIVRGARHHHKDKHQSMNELAKTLHQDKLDELKEMPAPTLPRAYGGDVSPMQEVTCPHCTKSFSHGGQVANDTGQGAAADEMPNEFDDLVLDDDAEMDGYTGANSGDEDGGPSKDDVVARAMIKRKKAKRD